MKLVSENTTSFSQSLLPVLTISALLIDSPITSYTECCVHSRMLYWPWTLHYSSPINFNSFDHDRYQLNFWDKQTDGAQSACCEPNLPSSVCIAPHVQIWSQMIGRDSPARRMGLQPKKSKMTPFHLLTFVCGLEILLLNPSVPLPLYLPTTNIASECIRF